MLQVTLQDIKEAKETIKDIVKKTDMLECASLSNKTKANVFYKCENLQRTGSFKVRGACNKIANLTDEEKANGVIASSAGNHAQGVALGAKMSGIKSTIVMPATAPLLKVSATKGYGAEVVLNGLVYDDAYSKAVEIQKETGATFLHPFNDKHVIAGQGTIGLEIFEQLNDKVDTILCPIGGGGLIAGVAVAARALNPNVKVIGVQEIAQGIVYLMENLKVVAEGSGAVTTAALLSGKYAPNENENVVCIISGGNVDVNNLYRIIGSGLAKEGRRYSFSVTMIDKPGGFSELTKIISENNANILNANQSRLSSGAYIGKQNAEFVLETFDHDHIQKIKSDIEAAGFEIKDL